MPLRMITMHCQQLKHYREWHLGKEVYFVLFLHSQAVTIVSPTTFLQ